MLECRTRRDTLENVRGKLSRELSHLVLRCDSPNKAIKPDRDAVKLRILDPRRRGAHRRHTTPETMVTM